MEEVVGGRWNFEGSPVVVVVVEVGMEEVVERREEVEGGTPPPIRNFPIPVAPPLPLVLALIPDVEEEVVVVPNVFVVEEEEEEETVVASLREGARWESGGMLDEEDAFVLEEEEGPAVDDRMGMYCRIVWGSC